MGKVNKDIEKVNNDLRKQQLKANEKETKEKLKLIKHQLNEKLKEIDENVRINSEGKARHDRRVQKLNGIEDKKRLKEEFKEEQKRLRKKSMVRDKIMKLVYSSKLRKANPKAGELYRSNSAPIYNPSYSTIPMSKIKFVGDYQKGKARAREQQREKVELDYSKGVVTFKDYLTAAFNIPEIKNISMQVGDNRILANIENLLDENGKLTNFVGSDFIVDFLQKVNANNIVLTKSDGTPIYLSNLNTVSRQETIEKAIKDSQKVGFAINGKQNDIQFSTFSKEDGNRYVVAPLASLVSTMNETEISDIIIQSETCISAFKDGAVTNFVRNNAGEYVPIDEASREEIEYSGIDTHFEKNQNEIDKSNHSEHFFEDHDKDESNASKMDMESSKNGESLGNVTNDNSEIDDDFLPF